MRNIKWPAFLRVFGKSVVDWWDGWMDFEIMGVVWLIAQVTVILGPPATFGVYYAVNTLIRTGENIGLRGAIDGARKYFLRGLAWGAMNWAVLIISFINMSFYFNLQTQIGLIALIFIAFVTALWLIVQFYAVPFYMAQEQEKIFLAFRNGLYLALASPLFTLGLMIFVLVIIALSVVFVIPAFLALPMLVPVLATRALYDRLEAFGIRKKDPDPREV